MAIRDRVRKVKHLRNRNLICVIEEPDLTVNVGTIIRNISAFGVDKLYVVGGDGSLKDFNTSRNNRKLASASVGANKWVFVKNFKTTSECLDHLRKNNYIIATTSPHLIGKTNINLYKGDFTQKRLAVWFGNEARGVSSEAVQSSDFCINIPMGGIVESLNLGTSTGIVLSYISHQRLEFVFKNKKIRKGPVGLRAILLSSWDRFSKNA